MVSGQIIDRMYRSKVNGHVSNWTFSRTQNGRSCIKLHINQNFKIWAAVNSEGRAIWYLCGEDGKIDATEYIEIIKKFQNELREQNIDPSNIVFQQDGAGIEIIILLTVTIRSFLFDPKSRLLCR